MGFVPLGLDLKIYRYPWVTGLLVLIIVMFSIMRFPGVDHFETVFIQSPLQLALLSSKISLLDLLCKKSEKSITPRQCQALEPLRRKQFYALYEPASLLENNRKVKLSRIERLQLIDLLYETDLQKTYGRVLQGSPELQLYRETKIQLDEALNRINKEHDLPSRGNLNFRSLTAGQFTHSGWLHLLGNLLFFILLSVFVELRVGSLIYPAVFLIPGYLGLLAQLAIISSASTPLMGASANISGIAGAFTVFFWRQHLKCLFLGGVYNKVVLVPVSFFFPVLVFSGDIVGALNSSAPGVAHVAHLGGFVAGTVIAFGFVAVRNLPRGFLFPVERKLFLESKNLAPLEQEKKFFEILTLNHENEYIHEQFLKGFGNTALNWQALSDLKKKYVRGLLASYVVLLKKRPEHFVDLIHLIHPSWPLAVIFSKISLRYLIRTLDLTQNRADTHGSLIISSALLQLKPILGKQPEFAEEHQRLLTSYNQIGSKYAKSS